MLVLFLRETTLGAVFLRGESLDGRMLLTFAVSGRAAFQTGFVAFIVHQLLTAFTE